MHRIDCRDIQVTHSVKKHFVPKIIGTILLKLAKTQLLFYNFSNKISIQKICYLCHFCENKRDGMYDLSLWFYFYDKTRTKITIYK